MTDSTVCHVTQGTDDIFLPHRVFFMVSSKETSQGAHFLAVEESSSHETAPTYCQSPQKPQGVTYAWFCWETLHYLF